MVDYPDTIPFYDQKDTGAGSQGAGGILSGAIKGGASGAAAGSAIPVWGTAVGAAAGAVIGGVGAAIGNSKAAKAYNVAKTYNNQRMQDLSGWFNREYYGDYLNSKTSKSALARMRQGMLDTNKQLNNSAVAGGSTAEAVIGQQGKLNNNYNNAVNNLVGMGDQQRNRTMYQYQGLLNPLQNNQQNMYNNEVTKWGQFGANAAGVGQGLIDMASSGAFGGGKGGKAKIANFKVKGSTLNATPNSKTTGVTHWE